MQKKHLSNSLRFLRWAVAIVGIWYVLSRMSWHDRILAILPGQTVPQSAALVGELQGETDDVYTIINGESTLMIARGDTVNEPDRADLTVDLAGRKQFVLGVDLSDDLKAPRRLLLADQPTGPTRWVAAEDVPDYHVNIPHPRVQIGVIRMVRHAKSVDLIAALLIFPITIFITSVRWHALLKALGIDLTLSRTFVLNMVGLFYNSFLPGSTSGDGFKAYYVARQTHHRTRAVMSVIVDRVIGLVALIILGGVMAALQWHIPKCRQVALGSAALLVGAAAAAVVFYVPILTKISGLDWLLGRIPSQHWAHNAVETLHIYGRRPGLVFGTLLFSFPVHSVVIISAMLGGMAFGLKLNPFYYWMAVPVIVLAGSIPISPQGAGVMEYFAIQLLEPQGVTVAQAFALTMSIRLAQIFWNLTGGYFVLRGGYHAPTESEQRQVEEEDEDAENPKSQYPLTSQSGIPHD